MYNAQEINERIAGINRRLVAVSSSLLGAYGTERGADLNREYENLLDELVGLRNTQNPDADWEDEAA